MSDQSIDNGPESSSKVNYAIPLLFKNKQSFSIRMKVSKRGIFLIIIHVKNVIKSYKKKNTTSPGSKLDSYPKDASFEV